MTMAAVASAKKQPFLPLCSRTYPRLVANLQHAGL